MKRQVLKDSIHGSFLKRQYLEAFLLQGAYIESLIKHYADFKFFEEVKGSYDTPILTHFRGTINNSTFGQIINFLFKTKIINSEQQKLLDTYCKQRNKVIHNLLKEIQKSELENELKEAYEKGDQTMQDNNFIQIEKALDYIEKKSLEALENIKEGLPIEEALAKIREDKSEEIL